MMEGLKKYLIRADITVHGNDERETENLQKLTQIEISNDKLQNELKYYI